MFIPDPGSWFYSSGSRIQKQQQKRGVKKKLVVKPFLVATNFTKLKLFYFSNAEEKKFVSVFKELSNFLPKNLSLSSKKYGVGIRDPKSGKNLFRIPDPGPGVKKAPDPESRIRIRKGTWRTAERTASANMSLQGEAIHSRVTMRGS